MNGAKNAEKYFLTKKCTESIVICTKELIESSVSLARKHLQESFHELCGEENHDDPDDLDFLWDDRA
jgi:hypothetical protein